MHYLLLFFSIFLFGCDENKTSNTTETKVSVNQYMMDAAAFDMEAVIAKLKQGKLADAKALEKFINTTSGVNNVDLNNDGEIDPITVKEERAEDGKIVMAAIANPKDGEPTTVAEFSFSKNTTANETVVEGAYPNYVSGYQDHYYRSTLTGSTIGDMMFYSWLFSPRPMFYHPYHYGMYQTRSVLPRSSLRSTRTSYRSSHNVSPVKKTSRPKTYKARSSSARKRASKIGNTPRKSGSSLKSKAGKTKTFNKRGNTSKRKASGFKSRPSRPATRPRPSPRRSFGSSRRSFGSRSFGSRRRSAAKYKHDIKYLTSAQRMKYTEQLMSMPMATWKYNDAPNEQHIGFIIDDVAPNACVFQDQVSLGDYTSLAVIAIQEQSEKINTLTKEVEYLREYILDAN